MTTPGGPPDTDEPWFVPVLALDDTQHGDGSEDDADDPDVSEVAPGTTLAWSSWAGEEQVPRRLAAAAGALALRLTEALPELSHQNPGGGERFEHAQLIAVLANALGSWSNWPTTGRWPGTIWPGCSAPPTTVR
ncbi:MAG: hypothetical protein IPF88_06020 [Candidatus Microthrix sp.]|nr:hypothetical protein [Candidatus Microthrix sp.]MBK6438140.1 hypothetical protein [Candidatus Microthrix sp.]